MHNVALIILNYCSFNDCVTCVDQLLLFESGSHIIIVDNQSPDSSYERLKEKYNAASVDVLQTTENRGYSAGNNFGIQFAVEKYHVDTVGVLNPDVFIPDADLIPGLLTKLYSDDSYAIIGACVINASGVYDPNASAWNIPSRRELWRGHCLVKRKKVSPKWSIVAPKLAQVECVAGCFFLAKVAHLSKIGYLDENTFLYNEENILGIKCKQEGFKEVLALDQFYYHNHRKKKELKVSFRKKVQATKNSYLSRRYMCKTYYQSRGLFKLWLAERINRIYLAGAYFKNKLFH